MALTERDKKLAENIIGGMTPALREFVLDATGQVAKRVVDLERRHSELEARLEVLESQVRHLSADLADLELTS